MDYNNKAMKKRPLCFQNVNGATFNIKKCKQCSLELKSNGENVNGYKGPIKVGTFCNLECMKKYSKHITDICYGNTHNMAKDWKVNCKYCALKMDFSKTLIGFQNRKQVGQFCSEDCMAKMSYNSDFPITIFNFKCHNCGHYVISPESNFCSVHCRDGYLITNSKKKRNPLKRNKGNIDDNDLLVDNDLYN